MASPRPRPVPGSLPGGDVRLPLSVLKGTTPLSLIAVAGLTMALASLGARVLREGEKPGARAVVYWTAAVIATGCAMTLLGTAG